MTREFAAAKLNLTLHVGPVRPDGYHPVDSLVVFADWGDRLTFEAADTLSLEISGEGAETLRAEDGNLVLKAAETLAIAAGINAPGARIRLDKSIPLGAGLGGGSADAAAALRGLNRLWELDWPEDMLAGLGAEIGSDVPACVFSRPLRMRGRGERTELLETWPALPTLLVNPRQSVSTGRIFALYDNDPQPIAAMGTPACETAEQAIGTVAAGRNDLQPHAVTAAGAVGEVLKALEELPAARLVRMTGSGSTCFALFDSKEAAVEAGIRIAASHADWLIQPVMLGGSNAA
ncbi:4-(cytidine 5'-diphospho)-2-C-methyl-D-erythritol kinase [Hyphobacterium sp. SN044]|uniref:4-(cytidine 5'-diphospho)-2-C-methyl-D-erythritol kinase n=1 Tax=Hyphobacterium sp. SN044 TaxID=2912575 RepID=UPI001F01033F|nr:4-(cytidine 5'-diphospho)-2-C-methyl-D-erythritol kinase [Hyphobacterium sp. SN044]